jgi:coenzyme Q-binding protein COQ10
MTTFNTTRVLDAPKEVLFSLVADVERYPHFLPMWKSVRVLHRQDMTYHTVQEVGFGPVNKRFKTQTILDCYNSIEITSNDRAFRNFVIQWVFKPASDGTETSVHLNWKMSSRMLQKAIDAMLPMTAEKMISSFSHQAAVSRSGQLVAKPAA